MARLVPVPPERRVADELSVPAQVATKLRAASLARAGQLIAAGFPEDCYSLLQSQDLLESAKNSPKFMAKVEKAIETNLRKGLDQNVRYILERFPTEDNTMETPKMKEAAYSGARLKTREGYFHFAKNILSLTKQDFAAFFTAPGSQSDVTVGLSAMLRRDNDGMAAVTKALTDYNIPIQWIQTTKFAAEAVLAIETRVTHIRGSYHQAAKRMEDVIGFIEATNLKNGLLERKTAPNLAANIVYIANRLERDGFEDRAYRIRKYFNLTQPPR